MKQLFSNVGFKYRIYNKLRKLILFSYFMTPQKYFVKRKVCLCAVTKQFAKFISQLLFKNTTISSLKNVQEIKYGFSVQMTSNLLSSASKTDMWNYAFLPQILSHLTSLQDVHTHLLSTTFWFFENLEELCRQSVFLVILEIQKLPKRKSYWLEFTRNG